MGVGLAFLQKAFPAQKTLTCCLGKPLPAGGNHKPQSPSCPCPCPSRLGPCSLPWIAPSISPSGLWRTGQNKKHAHSRCSWACQVNTANWAGTSRYTINMHYKVLTTNWKFVLLIGPLIPFSSSATFYKTLSSRRLWALPKVLGASVHWPHSVFQSSFQAGWWGLRDSR